MAELSKMPGLKMGRPVAGDLLASGRTQLLSKDMIWKEVSVVVSEVQAREILPMQRETSLPTGLLSPLECSFLSSVFIMLLLWLRYFNNQTCP